MKNPIAFLLLLTCPLAMAATPLSLHLSMKEAIALALRYNPNVQNAELSRIVQKYSLRLAEWNFEPQYQVNGQWSQNTGKSNNIENVSNTYGVTPQATLNTKIGTAIAVGMNNNVNNGHYQPAATLSLTQPLLRGFGTDINTINLKNAYDQEFLNKLGLRDNVENAVQTIIQDYRQLMESYTELNIQEAALKNAEDNLKRNNIYIKAGKMAPKENVQAQADIAQSRLNVTNQENTVAQNILQLLMDIGLDPDTHLSIDQSIELISERIPSYPEALALMRKNDATYQQIIIQKREDERALLLAKDNKRWQLNVSEQASMGGGQDANALVNGKNYSQTTTLSLNIPVDDLALEEAVVAAKVAVDQDTNNLHQAEYNLITNVKNTLRNLQSQKEQININEDAVKLKAESLSITQQKQELGKASMLDVSTARQNLITAQTSLSSQKIAYLNAITAFYNQLGILLPRWGISLRY